MISYHHSFSVPPGGGSADGHAGYVRQQLNGEGQRHGVRAVHHAVLSANLQSLAEHRGG